MSTQKNRREFLRRTSAAVLCGGWPLIASRGAARDAGKTGYVYDPRYLEHILEPGHVESPERLKRISERMKASGLTQEVVPLSPAVDAAPHIERFHRTAHVQAIRNIPTTGEVSALAVSGALTAVKAVAEERIRNAFCAIRPPGHHANNRGAEEGFCFYSNAAIAARYAQWEHGYDRVLIVDWDYHHGNGTENAFWTDPSVLFFSTHNWHAYPGTGDPGRRGAGDGYGYNYNLHFDCGATDDQLLRAFETTLVPAAQKFRPDLILISAGFDSRKDDVLGCFSVTDDGFRKLTRLVMELAAESCKGRIVSLLEGGYNVEGLALAVEAHLGELLKASG